MGGKNRWRIVVAIVAFVLAAVIVGAMVVTWDGSARTSAEKPPVASDSSADREPQVQTSEAAKPTVSEIVARRPKSWDPQLQEYIGKPAPEFTARDLDGKVHSLSDYRGKDVLLVFWAMWCAPCREEIPSIVKLRQSIPEDKLAIIAVSTDQISYDPIVNSTMHDRLVERLRDFARTWKMNYTILTLPSSAERPYSRVNILPSAFFIGPDGTIKLVTAGIVPLRDMEAIIAAEN